MLPYPGSSPDGPNGSPWSGCRTVEAHVGLCTQGGGLGFSSRVGHHLLPFPGSVLPPAQLLPGSSAQSLPTLTNHTSIWCSLSDSSRCGGSVFVVCPYCQQKVPYGTFMTAGTSGKSELPALKLDRIGFLASLMRIGIFLISF